jgi:hypothetical protein
VKFEFVYTYPIWFIPGCILIGILYSYVLYRKNHGLTEIASWIVRLLAILRATMVSILCFLLFSPILRINTREVEKPVIILLQDNTESIKSVKDSVYYKNDYPKEIETLSKSLEENFELKRYSFDDNLLDSFNLNFTGKETDISQAVQKISDLYENRNVGAIILASDGIYNKGNNPLYLNRVLNVPFYTIGLGDTTVQRDIFIQDVQHNQLAYLNNTFPINVVVQAQKLKGKSGTIKIERDGVTLAEQVISISETSFVNTYSFQLKADKTGIQRYKISIKPIEGEFTLSNNSKDVFIEVIDSRQKVLVLASSPHPDIAAIRSSLEGNQNYEVDVQIIDQFNESVKPYSLVILHQLPSQTNLSSKVIKEISDSNIPAWFIVGASTLAGGLNTIQKLIQVNGSRGGMNDVYPTLNESFALFTISDELKSAISRFGPLQVPIANYVMQPSAISLFKQKIGAVSTNFPLFVFSADVEQKVALLAGEGIWRWRMQDFGENGNHLLFDELISKTVQYLSVRNERKNLRVVHKNSYNENERIRFDAEVYNASYELVNSEDVALIISNDQGKKYQYSFSKTSTAYTLDAGMFREGNYTYIAKTKVGSIEYSTAGQFLVKPVTAERSAGRADHSMLKTLALRNGGSFVTPSQMQSLSEQIKARPDVKPVSHVESKMKELIRFPWIFALILLLLGIEWFIRRRNGAY